MYRLETAGDRSVLRLAAYWRWSAATMLMRMPGFMTPLAFVLIALYATSDRRVGGLMVAAEVVTLSVGAPLLARPVDRFGPRRALIGMALVSAAALSGLAYVTGVRGTAAALVIGAGLVGAAGAARSAGARVLLDEVVPRHLQRDALSLNATLTEITVLSAPLLIGALALAGVTAVPLAMAAFVLAGAALVPGLPRLSAAPARDDQAEPAAGGWGLAVFLRSRSFWFWMAVELAFGQVLGTVEPSALPWARHLGLGTSAAAGVLATLSAAGILASVAYLRLNHPGGYGRARTEALVMVGSLVGGGFGFALSSTWLVGAIGIALIGIATVPLNGLIPHAAADSMPQGRYAEGFAILGSVYAGGYALGSVSLALLPLRWTLLSGPAAGVLVLALTPWWVARGQVEG